jgi:hypothetical protein
MPSGRSAYTGSRRQSPPFTWTNREGDVGIGGFLAGDREEGAVGGRLAAALLGDLEPALHGLGAVEQRLDLAELSARELAHLAGHAVRAIDADDELLYLVDLKPALWATPMNASLPSTSVR